ncbi:MAG: serine/threonine-protein kinase, partial [Planctomycetes bacterium]|nr:serine/threonine-protein kinase [Planctomycetota bacterium]
MSAFSKGLIAAVVAVRTGRVAPDVAAKLVLEADSEDELFVGITNAASLAALDDGVDDPFSGGTVAIAPMDIEAIVEGLKSGSLDTAPLGLDERAKAGLKELQDVDDTGKAEVIKNTLLSLVPTESQRAKAVSSNDDTLQARSVTTIRPSTRSLERLGAPDRYKIRKEHARGGMGRILIARDNVVGREVALKELLPEISSAASVPPGSVESQGITERFLREAKVTGQLEHPNIVTVYEIGKHKDGSIYYTMKFVHGETMSRRLNNIESNETLNESEKLAARIRMLDSFADVCNAIAFAHSRHVIHRDLKPDNIMIGEFGETVVLDWGLARVQGQEDEAAKDLQNRSRAISDSLLHGDSANLTLDGSVVGTPAYMAPEQARGKLDEIDERTDVYALGAVLYQILSGRPPYEGPSAGLIVQQVLAGPPIRLKSIAPNVPPELINLVERAMAQDKSQRFASARELASEVQAFRDGRTLASYNYSAMENIKRWANRHKAQVLTAALAISIIITGTVYSMVELQDGKQKAERDRRVALVAKKQAEASFKLARKESKAASEARAEAEFEAGRAADAAEEAKEAKGKAETEADRSNELLGKLRFALAEDYAARVQFSQGRGDYNSAYAYAAACLKTIDHPRARGAVMSDGQVIPRVWQFEPDELATQDIYEFYALAVSPDSKLVATGNRAGQISIWSLQAGEKVQTLNIEGGQLFSVAFHPSEPILVAATANKQLVRFRYNLETLEFKQDGSEIEVRGVRVASLEFSPDGTTLAMGGEKLFILNWPELTVRFAPETNDYWPMIARFSPDGTKLATTSLLPSLAFGDVSIWDISADKIERRTIPSNRWELFSAWSPDSKKIATAGFGGEITIRDANKMFSKGIVLRGHTSTVLQVTYSPSGKYIASASADGTVRLWSTHSGRSVAQLSGFPSWIQSVVFDTGETLLLLRDIRGRISVWDIRDFDRNSLSAHQDDGIAV